MGFSDAFKKAVGQISGGGAATFGAGEGFSKRAKSGRMQSGDFLSSTLLPTLGQTQERLDNPFNVGNVFSADLEAIKGSAFGANVGHQLGAALFRSPSSEDAPPVAGAPSQNEQTIAAKRQARQRAINAAAQRRGQGLSGTVATTPLGLQGDGAAISSRRLIGE